MDDRFDRVSDQEGAAPAEPVSGKPPRAQPVTVNRVVTPAMRLGAFP